MDQRSRSTQAEAKEAGFDLARLAAVCALLGTGADGRIADQQGTLPVLRTIESGEKEPAPVLLGKNAELDRRSTAGNSALMLASQGGNSR